jgi:hypothetical protein
MRSGNVAIVLVAILAVGALAVSGFTLYKLQGNSLSPQPTPTTQTRDYDQKIVPPTSNPNSSPSAMTAEAKVIVVWEPSGAFPASDKTQLQARVVDPLIDYYKEANQGKLVTVTISVNNQASATTYPYLGQAVLENGGTLGFVIEKPNGQIKWWTPECMGECPLSASFKTKYPEIVAILGY